MKPSRETHGGEIVDLLDKVFEKGIVLDADLIIKMGGIPLVGVSLQAAIAGMTKMLEYGVMEAWDQNIREWYAKEHRENEKVPLREGEELYSKTFGSHWSGGAVYSAWRQGYFYLTNERLFLFRKNPDPEILFEVELDELEGMDIQEIDGPGKTEWGLCLERRGGEKSALHAGNLEKFKNKVEEVAGGDLGAEISPPKGIRRSGTVSGEDSTRVIT